MRATLSILGIYSEEPTLFDNLTIPQGVDKENLVDTILMECAELEILFPEPGILKYAIGVWSKAQLHIWEKLSETTGYDYDPIYNYDRTEEYTDTEDTGVKIDSSVTQKGEGSRESNDNGSSVHKVTAYNTDESKETDRDETTSNINETSSGTNTSTENANNTQNRTLIHKARMYGNIGVTTTQAMIEEQRKVVKFSLIDYIANEFKHRFCLLVY